MGIYDRDYYQGEDQRRGFSFGGSGQGPKMMVTILIVINVAVYLIVELFLQSLRPMDHLALQVEHIKSQPWRAYEFLTYGFMHASMNTPNGIFHILFNMFMLFVFGRDLEWRFGRREFLTFYLVSIIFSGIVWWLGQVLAGNANASAVGASGGVSAVVILFCLLFPQRKLLLFGAIEMPAWVLGVLLVGIDVLRGLSANSHIGWEAHLGGAGFALLYFKTGIRLERFLPRLGKWKLKKRPRLKIHDPATNLESEADRILQKWHQQGEDSLTKKERKILEEHSRRVRESRSAEPRGAGHED